MPRQRINNRNQQTFIAILEEIEKKLLIPNKYPDSFFSDAFWGGENGIHSCLQRGSIDECILAVRVLAEILRQRPFLFRKRLCSFIVAILECMVRLGDNEFTTECFDTLLCKIDSSLAPNVSNIISAFSVPSLQKTIVGVLSTDTSILASLFHFISNLIKACQDPKTEVKPADFIALLRCLVRFIPFCQNHHQLVLKAIAYLLETADKVCPNAFNRLTKDYQVVVVFAMQNFKSGMDFSIGILQNCLKICPKILLSDAVFYIFVEFLINSLNISIVNDESDTDLSVKIFSIYSDLIKWLQSDKAASTLMTPEKCFRLFDPIRVPPVNDTHAASRLHTWWVFLCFLQERMLFIGTNRYVTPFLANLIGRYISVNESLGNRTVTKYRLSSVSVYNGSSAAQNLAMHVFACFFNYPELRPVEDVELEQLPKLTLSTEFLAEKGYILLVALLHWLRYLCGNGICVGGQKPSEIWAKCLWLIRRAVSETTNVKADFLAGCVIKLSTKLISPQSLLADSPYNMIDFPTADNSSNPDPSDCLQIINEVYDILASEHVSPDFKAPLYHELCLICLELISVYHKKYGASGAIYGTFTDIIKGLGEAAVESFRKDYRLSPKMSEVNSITLLHDLIATLSPDCFSVVVRLGIKFDTLEDIKPSRARVTMNTAIVNEVGLNVWSVMVDCLTRLLLQHPNLTDMRSNYIAQKHADRNLITVFSFLLTPIFLAGNTKDSPSPNIESGILDSMFQLFRAFRQKALSLTAISINACINKLSMYIIALIQSRGAEVEQSLNLRIIANFLSFLVESVDVSEDAVQAKLRLPQGEFEKDQLLGYLLGPVEAISRCLTFMPLEDSEMSISNAVVVFSSQLQESRSSSSLVMRTSLDAIMSPSKLFEKVFLEFAQLHQVTPTSSQSVTRNLLHSLWLILLRNKHIKENIFILIDRCSFGLLSLSKRLESVKLSSSTDEAPALIVSAYEAFVTMAWSWILRSFNKPSVVDDPNTLKKLEMEPLAIPKDLVRRLLVFFEGAVRIASCPVSSVVYRIDLGSEISSVASTSLHREKLDDQEAEISRRHKMFIYSLVSIWDTLVVSTVADREIRARIASATTYLSKCLAMPSSPQISLLSRATLPSWILEVLTDHSEQVPDDAESVDSVPRQGGPENTSTDIVNETFKTIEIDKASGKGTLTDDGEIITQKSSSQLSTDSPSKSSLQAISVTESKCTVSTPELTSAELFTEIPEASTSSATLPSKNQNQLRPSSNVGNTNVISLPSTTQKVIESVSNSRKRRTSSSIDLRPLPNTLDFEDSSDFVFIPPTNTPNIKRMRLTEHQKDRKREQRQAYIPPMFNSLDRDSNDAVWALYPSDSQSSLDSAQSSSRQGFVRVTPSTTQSQTLACNFDSSRVETQPATDVSSIKHMLEVDANSNETGIEEENSLRLDVRDVRSSEKKTPRKGVVIHSMLLPDNDITNPNGIRKTRLVDIPASPSVNSIASTSPMMSPPPPLLRSPGLNNSRTLKILQNSRAEIEKKQKLRMAQLKSMVANSLPTTPLSSPARTGILKDSVSNQDKHVSFADQATVIVIDNSSSESSVEDEQPPHSSPEVTPRMTLLPIETGPLNSSQATKLILSPLTPSRGEIEASSPSSTSPPSTVISFAGTRRRKSTSPKRCVLVRSGSKCMTRRRSVEPRDTPLARRRVFSSLESGVDSESPQDKKTVPVHFADNHSSSFKLSSAVSLPPTLPLTIIPTKEVVRSAEVKMVDETQTLQESEASGNLVGAESLNHVEIVEATQEFSEINGKVASVSNDIVNSEQDEPSLPDLAVDTQLENADEHKAFIEFEVQKRPEPVDLPVIETDAEVVTGESRVKETEPNAVDGEGIHLSRIRRALEIISEELPSLTREQRRDAVMEIIAFLHPFCLT